MRTTGTIPRAKQRGTVLIMLAIGLVAMLATMGLALDLGHAHVNQTRLQNAVDAAALSGAKTLNQFKNSVLAGSHAIETFNQHLEGELAQQELVPKVEFSNTLSPFVAGGSDPRYIKVSVQQYEMPVVLASVLPEVTNIFTLKSSAVAGPMPLGGGQICDIAPLLMCGNPADTDCTDGSCYGFELNKEEELCLKASESGKGKDEDDEEEEEDRDDDDRDDEEEGQGGDDEEYDEDSEYDGYDDEDEQENADREEDDYDGDSEYDGHSNFYSESDGGFDERTEPRFFAYQGVSGNRKKEKYNKGERPGHHHKDDDGDDDDGDDDDGDDDDGDDDDGDDDDGDDDDGDDDDGDDDDGDDDDGDDDDGDDDDGDDDDGDDKEKPVADCQSPAKKPGPGNYNLISLSCGNGASCVRDTLAGSYSACVNVGEAVYTKPGKATGPTAQGVNTRFGIYQGGMNSIDSPPDFITTNRDDDPDFWHQNYRERYFNQYFDEPYSGRPNRRVIPVPIGDCKDSVKGRSAIEVISVACVYLTRPSSHSGKDQTVYGQLIGDCEANGIPAENPVAGPSSTGFGPYKIILFKDEGAKVS